MAVQHQTRTTIVAGDRVAQDTLYSSGRQSTCYGRALALLPGRFVRVCWDYGGRTEAIECLAGIRLVNYWSCMGTLIEA